MKNCQDYKKRFNKKIFNISKKLSKLVYQEIYLLIFLCLTLSLLFGLFTVKDLGIKVANAKDIISSRATDLETGKNFIQVGNKWIEENTLEAWLAEKTNWIAEKAMIESNWIYEKGWAAAWKTALNNFLNKMAYDTATYIATGDKGQSPMFQTDTFGEYLKNSADTAAGDMLEVLGKNGPIQFNLCNPSTPMTMLKINLGLWQYKPKKPECTFSKMTKDWEKALQDKNFLINFQDMFNPWSNDLGIALSLQSGVFNEVNEKLKIADKLFPSAGQFKPVTDPISGKTKTPAGTVEAIHNKSIEDSTKHETTYTEPGADVINIFFNTLLGKLIEKYLKEGMVTNFPDNSYNWSKLQSETAAGGGGTAAAEERFAAFTNPNFSVRGDYNIMAELTMCPDPTRAGPTECVITDEFRQAIENRLTVGQAMKQGYLNANGIFGFSADGLEPSYYDSNYPYRSMIILRKFRILPVGWELAAEYIKNNPQNVGSTRNLGDLVACFDSADGYDGYFADWCAGLVDPGWVLKAPLNYCKREGPGPQIISEMIVGEGEDSQLAVSRNDNYCGDEQGCIKENSDGSCQLYGYCTEERRTWNFNASTCEPKYNTCQTFRARDGSTASYLENTLDYCGSGEAGCRAYCADYNYAGQDYTCTADSGDKIHFNKNAETCDNVGEGCHEFVRIKPGPDQTLAEIEAGGAAKAYSDFFASGLIYQKLLPAYLEGVCYELTADGFQRLKSGAPEVCGDYTRKCNGNELGCELYTSVKDNMSIAAKVGPDDYCDAECVAYDGYVQAETAFESRKNAYFIPPTAKTCGAEAAGCDEFTNLDKVEQGGEARENYIYLRQCVKPDSPGANCGSFYTWEGSDEAGYQLKSFTLKKETGGSGPFDISGGASYQDRQCASAADYDLLNNPMCREFYNDSGQVFYRFYNFTATCSPDCHPYRLTGQNIDPLITVQADCQGADKHWQAGAGEDYCLACLSGGVWSDQQASCVYMAIPNQGISCSAANVGCREYSGNEGSNMNDILISNFDNGSAENWEGVATNIEVSNESLSAGGGSLWVKDGGYSIGYGLGGLIHQGSLYTLSFLAKAQAASQISAVYLINNNNEKAEFTIANLSNEWVYYKINLPQEVEHIVSSDEKLVIEANGGFYIDNIKLTEIADRYYLIKDSWATPDVCNQNIAGDPYPLYDLGCEKYTDRDGGAHYLRSFSQLCAESAVGCELMIDTHNYSGQDALTVKGVTVPADSFSYVVYNQDKQCPKEDKGCQRLGDPYQYENDVIYGDVYLKNDPDKYNEILCLPTEVGCEEWTASEGVYYFRDPGDMACEWRQQYQGGFGWFKKQIARCDTNADGAGDGGICRSDYDCAAGQPCLEESGDNPCPTSPWLTFGYGGSAGQLVNQPTHDLSGYWAGLCPASQAGCSEYIDPISAFNANIIFNADFSQDVDSNGPDGWSGKSQEIALAGYSLYRLAGEGNVGSVSLDCPNILYVLNENNVLTAGQLAGGENVYRAGLAIDSAEKSVLVYSGVNTTGCRVEVGNAAGQIELKKAMVDYQIKSGLDKKSCNGLVDFEKGCVLFNERTQNGGSLAGLSWDADLTASDQDGVAPQAGVLSDRDANTLLKVSPDRVCNQWLACRSFIKDESDNNVCFDIGLCDSFDDNGNCNNFVVSPKQNQLYSTAAIGKYSNATGYAKVGYNSGGALINDYYPFGAMEQDGEVANVPNGNFEFAGSNGYPIGWTYEGGGWNENVFRVVDNPIGAQAEGVGYAPEGRSFLKLGSIYSATSEFIDVIDGIEYIITANVNTINLSEGSAKIKIDQYNSIGNKIEQSSNIEAMSLNAGSNWNFEVGKFITNPSATRIKITLHSQAGTTGNFYFDDVRIKPALISREQNASNWHTVQDCRLYPEDDALSCDYFNDSGDRQKGWPGYCLEYDRYPGSPDACLLWYPIDKVKGDGIDEGAGYNGKIPVYYCLEAEGYCDGSIPKMKCNKFIQTVSTAGNTKYWAGRVYEGSNYIVPLAGASDGRYIDYGINNDGRDNIILNYNRYLAPFGSAYPPFPSENPYEWDGNSDLASKQPLPVLNSNSGEASSRFNAGTPYAVIGGNVSCNNGQSVTKGQCGCPSCSDWISLGKWDECRIVSQYGPSCNFKTDASSNWSFQVCDDCGNDDCDNCTVTCYNNLTYNMSSSVDSAVDNIKRLFAQSYGYWTWNSSGGYYQRENGQDWSFPATLCSGGSRPAYPSDYCAISPIVNNIKVNNQTANVALNKNGFVNLTFNSKVDSQQQPLVMYAIDWGDNEKMVVTGVEMRDRSNEKNPHSLYHLYSYWDLKAKDAGGATDVDCDSTCSISATVNDSCCWVKPRVKIKDNWGWCNGGTAVHDCDQWQDYGGWIVVTEK